MGIGRLGNELHTRLFQKSAVTAKKGSFGSNGKFKLTIAPTKRATSGSASIRFSPFHLNWVFGAIFGWSRNNLAAAATLASPAWQPELTSGSNSSSRVDLAKSANSSLTQLASPSIDVLQKWFIPANELQLGSPIASGASATVFRGCYNGHNIALKALKPAKDWVSMTAQAQTLAREVLALSRCRHPNVLAFHGICLHPYHGISIITKLMQGGSLFQYLQQHNSKLATGEVLRIAKDIAEGMRFLHSHGIIHMDLKSENILLNKKKRAVIADLGVSRSIEDDTTRSKSSEVGSYKWMAPELYESRNGNTMATPKSDVYSFGIVLWELVTCKVPYEDYSPIQAAAGVVMHGLRPSIPSDCFPPLKYLMQKCWAQSPSDRPDFSTIVNMLHIMSSSRVGVDVHSTSS